MTREEIRRSVLQFLKVAGPTTNLDDLARAVGATKAGGHAEPASKRYSRFTKNHMPLTSEEEAILLETVHELIISNVVMAGRDRVNPNLPFITPTKYGKEVIAKGEAGPHDVDGYLADLTEDISHLDKVVQEYISQGLMCLRCWYVFAAAFLLGGASERLMLVLGNALCEAIGDDTERGAFQKRLDKMSISRVSQLIKEKLSELKPAISGQLNRSVKDYVEHMDHVFGYIRLTRNEVGHPRESVPDVTYEMVYGSYCQFPTYVRRMYELIDFFHDKRRAL